MSFHWAILLALLSVTTPIAAQDEKPFDAAAALALLIPANSASSAGPMVATPHCNRRLSSPHCSRRWWRLPP